MDANVNLKQNKSLRKLKIMSNNKIYRAYEIEFPKELKPTYDFLQGKLLEILTKAINSIKLEPPKPIFTL